MTDTTNLECMNSYREAKRELEQGNYVMILQGFIDDYRAAPEEMKASGVIDDDDYAEVLEYVERVIAAVTETAKRLESFGDGYFEAADEFNVVMNYDGKQYVMHWAL